MFIDALLVTLVCFICYFLHYWFAFTFTDRAIIVGPLVGLVLGDLETGILCGATFELIFMGVMTIGAAVPSDVTSGAAVGTAFVILGGLSMESAVAIAVVVGLLCAQIQTIILTINTMFNPKIDKLIENDNRKGIYIALIIQTGAWLLLLSACTFITVYFGSGLAQSVINALPEFVTNGLSIASGTLIAVGLGMLLNIMWTKELAVYFFVGCVLSIYFHVPVLGVAMIGILYSIICYFTKKDTIQNTNQLETEELFND